MKRDVLELASDLARRGEPFALATVIARAAPISAHIGDAALVTADGRFFGWVGGSCTRPTVIAEALQALADGRPRLVALDPNPESRRRPGLTVHRMTCHSGGSVEIHIEPVVPAPRLVVFGVSPTARALVRLGKAMGYAVEVVDAAADAADFPDANAVVADPAAAKLRAPEPPAAPPSLAVIATQGQWDEEALGAALAIEAARGRPFAYLAVMASPKRFGEMRALLDGKAPAERLAAIKNPAGLDLKAETAEEIALSILAEIVKELRSTRVATAAKPAAAAAPPAEARDPICGMMVTIAGAAHTATRGGQTYYFCCGGCRERFLAEG
jgi:xanthine dehydrogenase accessory factor